MPKAVSRAALISATVLSVVMSPEGVVIGPWIDSRSFIVSQGFATSSMTCAFTHR
jgi:hypothetical protein